MRRFLLLTIFGGMILALSGCASLRPDEGKTTSEVFKLIHPSTAELEKAIQDRRAQTVVNFRGFEPEQKWYRDQVELCRKAKVKHIDATVNPAGPEREEVIALLETFHGAPKPIALCDGWGGEESGFAMALYRIAVLRDDRDVARKELPFWQSQNAPIGRFRELDRFFADWRDEREFYATYQLPDGASSRAVAAAQSRSSEDRPVKSDRTNRRVAIDADTGALDSRPNYAVADRIPSAWSGSSEAGKPAPRQNWSTRMTADIAWKWLTNDNGVNLVWTDRGGLQEAPTIRDYRSVIVDSPTTGGPRMQGKSRSLALQPTRAVDSDSPGYRSPEIRYDSAVLPTSHWRDDADVDSERHERSPRPVGLGRPR